MAGVSEHLHSSVNDLVKDLGWTLTPIQNVAIPDIVNGKDRLLVAPTGSGKTESAILPIISKCLTEKWSGLSVLYITPLRALTQMDVQYPPLTLTKNKLERYILETQFATVPHHHGHSDATPGGPA